MTKLEEIKAKVDAVIDSYRNEEGNIVDEKGEYIGVLFTIIDKKHTGITQGARPASLCKMICAVLSMKSENDPIGNIFFTTAISKECMKIQEKALVNITKKIVERQ